MLYVFYITTTPYLPCNNKNINRKDFYYTAITLTTGYKLLYSSHAWQAWATCIYSWCICHLRMLALGISICKYSGTPL